MKQMVSRALRRVQAMPERDKLALALLVLLWLVAGWWFFFHAPMREAVEAMQVESAQAHAQLVDVENYRQQGQSIEAAEKAQNVSISLGYAYAEEVGHTTFRKLLDEADQKMYAQKKEMHNQHG